MNILSKLGQKTSSDLMASSERSAVTLRELILSGRLPPGTALREISLAAEIAVSRNTLREALRQLATEGLVQLRLHKGATVRTIPPNEVRDIFAVRRAIEQRAIEESAIARQDQFGALEKAVATAEKAASAGQWQEVGTASLRFHQSVVGLLDSAKLNAFFHTILAQLRLAMPNARSEANYQMPWVARDREICELICAGKRDDASRAMRIYLADSEKNVLDIVRANWRGNGTSHSSKQKRLLRPNGTSASEKPASLWRQSERKA
jgi:DNA-binding GntR family transcriptional regulator